MFPSSAIRVVESSPSRLVIFDPPYYGLGLGLLLVAAISAGLWFLTRSNAGAKGFPWWIPLLVSPFLLGGIGLMTSTTRLVLSAGAGTVKLSSCYFVFVCSNQEFRLGDLQGVRVETSEGFRSLVFLLKSGETFSMGGFSSRAGYYEAEGAINEFLKSNASDGGD
jgi:hypothetical protein